jgi:hypothetical protein
VTLARRRDRTELARAALIRVLDDIGPADISELPWAVREFDELGDFPQACRAQRLYVSLQDTDLARGIAYTRLSALERQAGDLDQAWTSLQHVLTTLDGPPSQKPDPPQPALFEIEPPPADDAWREKAVALDLMQEHFLLARSAADSGNPALAHRSLITGTALLDTVLAQEEQRIAECPYDVSDNND